MARSIVARYEGKCSTCPDWIEPGDTIVMTDDGAVHVDCFDGEISDPIARGTTLPLGPPARRVVEFRPSDKRAPMYGGRDEDGL